MFAPHVDDAEFGCGATIVKLVDSGCEVFVFAFSDAALSLPDGFPEGITREEFVKAMDTLGVPKERRFVFSYPVRDFPVYRQDILDEMIPLVREDIKPDLVIGPNTSDTHQDHQVIAEEIWRASKYSRLVLGYEAPRNDLGFVPAGFVEVTEDQVLRKITAINCYESQKSKNWLSTESVYHQARIRGTVINKPFAEAYEVRRWRD